MDIINDSLLYLWYFSYSDRNRLVMVTTEKPKMSLRRFLNKKMESKAMTEEQYKGSIRKLIRNVLFRHDACIASRNLNPHKIHCLFK